MTDKNLYPIESGKIKTRALEAHIVDHCNLRCEGCCSLSPFLTEALTSPEDLAADLALASRVLSPTYLKIVGGEPLLHPNLIECLNVAKQSGVAPVLSVTTNGLLLHTMPDDFWRLIDALTISLYPSARLPQKAISQVLAKAEQFGVHLNWKRQDVFVQMDRPSPCDDVQVNASVFSDCWLKRRCHLVRAGRLFTCTRSVHFQTRADLLGQNASFFEADGIGLKPRPGLLEELHAYLTRRAPLLSCAHCKGGNAATAPHRQIPLKDIRLPKGQAA